MDVSRVRPRLVRAARVNGLVTAQHPEARVVDRYRIHDAIGTGGMATVHLGRFVGPAGFSRTVAIKRMHPHLAKEPEFVAMFLDEARLAARIRHPNVVSTLDVLARDDELLIVMEYVHGASLGGLAKLLTLQKQRAPVPIACAIVADLLAGLHAAHEARDERGVPLQIVHRDVSPQNVLVGADGVSRVLDFGVAKAVGRLQQTRDGEVKGKVAYMAPEQLRGKPIARAADIYAASVVLWETLTGHRMFRSDQDAVLVEKILFGAIDAPSARAPSIPEALNAIVLRGLSREPEQRFATARDMLRAIRECVRLASPSEVGDWLEELVGEELAERAAAVSAIDLGANPTEGARASRLSVTAIKVRKAEDEAAVILPTEAIGSLATVLGELPLTPRQPVAGEGGPWRRVWWPLGTMVAATAAVATVWATSAPSAPAPPAVGVSSSLPAASALLPPLPPAASPGAAPAPGASVAASASSLPTPAPRPLSRPRPVKSDCTPPYTTDADGTRHYKLQCL